MKIWMLSLDTHNNFGLFFAKPTGIPLPEIGFVSWIQKFTTHCRNVLPTFRTTGRWLSCRLIFTSSYTSSVCRLEYVTKPLHFKQRGTRLFNICVNKVACEEKAHQLGLKVGTIKGANLFFLFLASEEFVSNPDDTWRYLKCQSSVCKAHEPLAGL